MSDENLMDNAVASFEESGGTWSLSIFAHPTATLEEICRRALERRNLRSGVVRTSTVGAIRGAGYDVDNWDDDWHADLMLGDEPTSEDWARLRGVFSADQRNPARKK